MCLITEKETEDPYVMTNREVHTVTFEGNFTPKYYKLSKLHRQIT